MTGTCRASDGISNAARTFEETEHMTPDEFDSKICQLLARAGKDMVEPAMSAAMMEALIRAAAMVIVTGARGNRDAINTLCEGASQLLFEHCARAESVGASLGSLLLLFRDESSG